MNVPPANVEANTPIAADEEAAPETIPTEDQLANHRDSDDDSSIGDDTSRQTEGASSSRDEFLEVQKTIKEDSDKVDFWRTASGIILLQTAITVTLITAQFLKDQETANFETGFDQFSRSLADSALAQQVNIVNGLNSMVTQVSLYADTNPGVDWPFVTVPRFEHYAHNVRTQARVEFITFMPCVQEAQREDYINYSNTHVQEWVHEGHWIHSGSLDRLLDPNATTYHPYITTMDNANDNMNAYTILAVEDNQKELYTPMWQWSPPPATYSLINYNAGSNPIYRDLTQALETLHYEVLATPVMTPLRQNIIPHTMTQQEHQDWYHGDNGLSHETPHTVFAKPIPRNISSNDANRHSEIVGIAAVGASWDVPLSGVLPEDIVGILAILQNSCGQDFTYEVRGETAVYLGEGDMRIKSPSYDRMSLEVDLALHTHPNFTKTEGHCEYELTLYPTEEFRSLYSKNTPEIFGAVIAITFLLVATVFFFYDKFVHTRNNNLMETAAKSNAIITDLFPAHLRGRLRQTKNAHGTHGNHHTAKRSLKTFLVDGDDKDGKGKPLADLFLATTVIFADIVGFTSWSSVREPSQVFELLESIYGMFDTTAKAHRVFKVETVGDCYVAVTGLPEPRKDHAILMGRFARQIMRKMQVHTRSLEKQLGPDTGDLAIRVGIHSGPVTAGVLRGERSRFQLFGDTMNMCARMESSSLPGKIQCSKETAGLLLKANKDNWLEKREEQVSVKGYKRPLETYWLLPGKERTSSTYSSTENSIPDPANLSASLKFSANITSHRNLTSMLLDARSQRLVEWNVEILLGMIRQIVAHRGNATKLPNSAARPSLSSHASLEFDKSILPLDRVKEIIHLPEFDSQSSRQKIDPNKVVVPKAVAQQLKSLVTIIATMYNDNPFHNFDHASHVVMSVTKLLARIVVPMHLEGKENAEKKAHDHTYGITSDPLTGFACAFAALIHDVDHLGVSNAQLVKEELPIASTYKGRSVAEQNSLELSWDLLMEPKYDQLREYLFPVEGELARFHQLVVNAVMSTDIVDKDLKALRNSRWDKAFKQGDNIHFVDECKKDEVDRKATIVIEHIIQASDISHTMQHWHVYRKWNQNLFEELYVAYLNDRMEKDPAEFWYKGEFGFFDFYIIPLTRKLKECGVFGVSSDEYLNYALKNREEWEARGEEVVAEMIEECHRKYGVKGETTPPEQAPPFAMEQAPSAAPTEAKTLELAVADKAPPALPPTPPPEIFEDESEEPVLYEVPSRRISFEL